MAGIYKINSKLGYDLANGLGVGQKVTATDGSVWTKNQDGSISVLQNGQQLTGQIDYQPVVQGTAAGTQQTGYTSPYAERLNQVISRLGDSKWEGWDANTDPSMQAYRKQYLREAERTEQDVLGQYAQNTGGIAGSAAIAAATQAGDYYKSQLADKVPQLYENAYARHLNEIAQQQNMANLLMNAESQQQSQYYNRINYAMSKWAQMGYADAEVASILGVAEGTPTSDQSYTDWSTAFQNEQWQYQKNQKMAADAAAAEEQVTQQDRLWNAVDNALTGVQKNKNLEGAYNLAVFMIQRQGKTDEEVYEKLRVAGYDDQTIAEAMAGMN